MPEFKYVGQDRGGQKVEGKINAPNEGEARIMLRGQGIRPTRLSGVSVFEADLGALLTGGGGKVPLPELVVFTRQLYTLIGSGVPLVQALESLSDQAGNASLKSILSAIKEKVASGTFFWESLAAYPKTFPKVYVSLIRAGEASGAMDVMLKRLSRYMEDAERLRKMMRSAMMYPIVVTSIAIGVISIMLVFVIPKFEELLAGSGQALPAPTQLVIDASHFMIDNAVLVFGGLAAGIFMVVQYIKSDEGRAAVQRLLFNAPVFGNLMQKSGVARFSRTMGTLLSSGVTLVDAIDICQSTVDNAVLEDSIRNIRSEVERGETLGGVVGRMPVFPRMAVQMIGVGENTGNLDSMLDKLADFYEEEVETIVGGMSKLIEPIVLVFLGGSVGFIMIAMYLPIFELAGSAG